MLSRIGWRLLASAVALSTMLLALGTASAASQQDVEESVRSAFQARAQELLSGYGSGLMDYYDVAYFDREAVVGTKLLAYERDKITEFHQWLGARKMQVISHEIELRFKRVTVSNGLAHATVTESMGFCWVYLDKPDQPIATGLGTDHEVDLVLKNGQWLIRRDDYLDPFRQWLKTDHRTPRG